ncbi:MAG: hypothetical protein KGL90_07140 [Burkholderiales bacterium]|nr:hypothetical protein [Burkholderiales bacterium]
MSQLQFDYIPLEELDLWVKAIRQGDRPRQVLGLTLFDGSESSRRHPSETLETRAWPQVALPTLGDARTTWVEVWSVPADIGPVVHGETAGVSHVSSADLVFAWLTKPLMGPDVALELATQHAYDAVFHALAELGYPHPLRFWNYLPDILGANQGEERYRLFNKGRHASFAQHAPAIQNSPPAACALGHPEGLAGPLTVYVIASRQPVQPIENPRQISAYRYPPDYGPRSPTFSRAAVAQLGQEDALFISGTASIVGHETVHVGNVQAQTEETLNNIEAVLNRMALARRGKPWRTTDLRFKAYVRHAADLHAVREVILRRLGPSVSCHYLHAVVCRPDLLVEIEATCATSH